MKHPMRKKIAKGKTKTGAEGQAARRPRIRVRHDGLLYVDYLNLNKAFYVMPLLWCSIRRILAKMPDTDELREKRDWLVKKYNRAIAGFDLSKFEERLLDRAWEREYIAQNYEEYRAAARSLALI